MDERVRSAIEARLGERITRAEALAGGDINDAYRLELASGRPVFAKTHASADPRMFPCEARGLAWLGEARALRVPEVLAVSADADEVSFLVLELLEPGPRCSDFDERLGRGLAELHRAGPVELGLDHDNFIGSLPQSNRRHSNWAEFFCAERLGAQLALPNAKRLLPTSVRRSFERLFERIDERVGPPEPTARLHGDLWGGNLHTAPHGAPVLIDPAVYGGHREMDLAMMRLFGGFSRRVFAAYQESHPLEAGHEERISLWQLYPLLVHVNLFGAGYVGSVASALERYVE
jgi:fructosamine-3-kinase